MIEFDRRGKTHEYLLAVSRFIATIEKRQGLKVAAAEETAFRTGYIDAAQLQALVEPKSGTGFGSP